MTQSDNAKNQHNKKDIPKPTDAAAYKKAVALGLKLSKNAEATKVSVAREMFKLISEESKEIIAQAFIEGAGLTEKGAMTYVYNIRREMKKSASY